MNARQVATGTILAASLTVGGSALAGADGARPAMDRAEVLCPDLDDKLQALDHIQDVLAAKEARLEARRADAQADGDQRRVRRIEHHLAKLARAQGRLEARVDLLQALYSQFCGSDNGPT